MRMAEWRLLEGQLCDELIVVPTRKRLAGPFGMMGKVPIPI
jgi:hypothetical protein